MFQIIITGSLTHSETWTGLDWIGIECGGMEFEGKGCERRKKQTICMLLKIHEHIYIYIQTEKDDEITKYLPPIM